MVNRLFSSIVSSESRYFSTHWTRPVCRSYNKLIDQSQLRRAEQTHRAVNYFIDRHGSMFPRVRIQMKFFSEEKFLSVDLISLLSSDHVLLDQTDRQSKVETKAQDRSAQKNEENDERCVLEVVHLQLKENQIESFSIELGLQTSIGRNSILHPSCESSLDERPFAGFSRREFQTIELWFCSSDQRKAKIKRTKIRRLFAHWPRTGNGSKSIVGRVVLR